MLMTQLFLFKFDETNIDLFQINEENGKGNEFKVFCHFLICFVFYYIVEKKENGKGT